MAFETLFDASNATPAKFEKFGDQVEGYYMGSFPYEGDYGPTKKHIFSGNAGAVVVFGQKHLIDLLPTVKPGTMVRVTYVDDKPTKRQPMKLFKIEQDKKNTIEVTGVELTPAATADEPDTDDTRGDYTEVEALDEAPPARATRPAAPARAPSAAQQASARALLSGKRQ